MNDDYDYRKVSVEELPDAPNPTRHKREVDEAVGATEFGFNLFVADPGERAPWGYHRHPTHEELFYVLEGALHVETPVDEFQIGPGEAFFIPADHPNCARAGNEGARFIAVGAPKDADGAVISEVCPDCGEQTDRDYRVEDDGAVYVLLCSDCRAEVDRLTAGPT